MDAGKGTCKVGNVKLEVERNSDGCDRLSELPDALLLKILCGMHIFEAILTSELSKRWKSLWMYLPKLNFGFDNKDQFIEGVLTQNKGGIIETFSIYKAYTKEEDIKIGSLISFAIARRVKELKLYLSHDDRADVGSQVFYKLPERLFLCESLVELDVWSCNFSPPSFIRMSCLKICSFLRTEMSEGTILRFTSSCPVIEKLKLSNCNSFSGLNIVLRNPSLLKLEVFDALARETKIFIDAPYVTSLVITSKNKERNRYVFKNLSSLIEATLNFEGKSCFGVYDYISVGNIINSIGHTKHLYLNNDCVKVLTMFAITNRKGPSIKSPRLEIKTELEMYDIPGLSFLFCECPLVENLKITLVAQGLHFINLAKWLKTGMHLEQECIFGSDFEIKDMPKSSFSLPEQNCWVVLKECCSAIPQGLKTIEICGFYDVSFLTRKVFEDKEAKQRILEFVWREIKLVGILLENLANLDRLIIRVGDGRSIKEDTPMGRKLLSFPRASQKLVFA